MNGNVKDSEIFRRPKNSRTLCPDVVTHQPFIYYPKKKKIPRTELRRWGNFYKRVLKEK